MGLPNPYTLAEMLEKLRYVLSETRQNDALELLEKAVSKSRDDDAYRKQLEATLLKGSTLECRELFSAFGDYIAPPRETFPPYPHMDAVNGIDSGMLAVKLEGQTPGAMQESIDFVKLMRGIA